MIDFLLGVPGKLKTVIDHLTTHLSSTRAAKIDNLDATISTRAAASTALSTATWTTARAEKLDRVDMPLIANSLVPILDGFSTQASCWGYTDTSFTSSSTTTTLVSYSGSGYVSLIGMYLTGINAGSYEFTIKVDGVTLYTKTASFAAATYGTFILYGSFLSYHNGVSSYYFIAPFERGIPFKTSFEITARLPTGSGNSIKGQYALRKTS